ncbi:MAG TPA: hypothetical protein VF656_09160 [Pyrinomonadaceae bacterium]|jgi:hypothetical protein
MKSTLWLIILAAAVVSFSCKRPDAKRASVVPGARAERPPTVSASPTPTPRAEYLPDQFGERLTDSWGNIEYTENDTLKYQSLEMIKRTKRVKIGDPNLDTDIEYAELQKHGSIVARFGESAREPHSSIRFGRFNFLGAPDEQLVVEQTANKFWRYWIVRVSPTLEVIYDSGKYDLVFDLGASDFDRDGRHELVQHLGTFWYFMAGNPDSTRPPVILAYDERARRYIPASPKFQNVLLADIEQRMAKVRELKLRGGVGVVDVVIRYLYAGKEREAWEFLERECGGCRTLFGEETLKGALKKQLRRDAFYREVSRRGTE